MVDTSSVEHRFPTDSEIQGNDPVRVSSFQCLSVCCSATLGHFLLSATWAACVRLLGDSTTLFGSIMVYFSVRKKSKEYTEFMASIALLVFAKCHNDVRICQIYL